MCVRLHSFWKYVSDLERRETRRYLQMFYILMMRPLIAKVKRMLYSEFMGDVCFVNARCSLCEATLLPFLALTLPCMSGILPSF